MYLPFMPRWEVQGASRVWGRGVYDSCGYNYRRKNAEDRANYLTEMTGRHHRVIDRRMFRR